MHLLLDRDSPRALTDQLFGGLKRMILDGTLAAGSRLPPTRSLAKELQVSRSVVVEVFERLAAEGFVEGRQGAGTRVCSGAFLSSPPPQGVAAGAGPDDRVPRLPGVGFGPLRSDVIDFRTGVPELREFPVAAWRKLQRDVWEEITPADLAYGAPEGRPELRRALASYLRIHRGVDCSPEQIILTSGTTQAIALVSSALRTGAAGGGVAVVEDPVTGDIPRIITRNGLEVSHVAIDEDGFDARRLTAGLKAAFVYVTPSHHYPVGVSLPIDRRVALVEYARRNECYLVEDDYDSEFRYRLPPVSTLHELAPDRVLYIGTFSKTLSPALRTAFVVAPWELIGELRVAKWHADLHSAAPDQLVLARFLEGGGYVRHLLRMRRLYERRWIALQAALEENFLGRAAILGSPAGLHVAVRFPGVLFVDRLLAAVERRGAKFYPVSLHTVRPREWSDCLVIGFGHLDADRIQRGIGLLAEAVD